MSSHNLLPLNWTLLAAFQYWDIQSKENHPIYSQVLVLIMYKSSWETVIAMCVCVRERVTLPSIFKGWNGKNIYTIKEILSSYQFTDTEAEVACALQFPGSFSCLCINLLERLLLTCERERERERERVFLSCHWFLRDEMVKKFAQLIIFSHK